MKRFVIAALCLITVLSLGICTTAESVFGRNLTKGFSDLRFLEDGAVIFACDGKQGVMDNECEVLIKNKYTDIYKCSCGMTVAVREDGKCDIYDVDYNCTGYGKTHSHPDMSIYLYDTSTAKIFGYTESGEPKEATLNGITPVEGVTILNGEVRHSGKFGYADKSGKTVISLRYEDVREFSDDGDTPLAAVKSGGKWGYIKTDGTAVTEFEYEAIRNINGKDVIYEQSENTVTVKCNGKYGFIDGSGNVIAECTFENALPKYCGTAWVEINGKWGTVTVQKDMAILPNDDSDLAATQTAEKSADTVDEVPSATKEGYSDIVAEPKAQTNQLKNLLFIFGGGIIIIGIAVIYIIRAKKSKKDK